MLCIFAVKSGLSQLDIPVAIAIPQEIINFLNSNAQFILFQIICNLSNQGVQLGQHPLISNRQLLCYGQFILGILVQIHQHIAAGIPQLISKVAHRLTALHIETHIVTGRIAGDHIHTQGIAAILINHFQRINAVTQGLRHLSTLIITNQAVNQNSVERSLSGMLTAGEDHSGNPEENNVIAGNQHIGGIEVIQILCLFRPTECLKRP